uniref:Uncharacterized protein n=1 Tax=Bicosoecida sp. CB-2014 TaxID=1486930 RepID=A0A7S1G3S2_9STRA|mmetsp:Transcript_14312/g.49732  ORF Transcript_14312/g.49732 Transcript_14312/m.49732 type:complete len:1769 (+) Transcript_14312:338-5644(+)
MAALSDSDEPGSNPAPGSKPAGGDDDAVCVVCMDGTVTDGNEILFCEKCDVAVHQMCYGVAVVPEDDWYCTPCDMDEDVRTVRCALCKCDGGALKPTALVGRKRRWAHVACVNWVPGATFNNDDTLEEVVGLETVDAARFQLQCVSCKRRGGACIQCDLRTCSVAFHPLCMLTDKKLSHDLVPQAGDKWAWQALCPRHAAEARKKKEAAARSKREAKAASKSGLKIRLHKIGPDRFTIDRPGRSRASSIGGSSASSRNRSRAHGAKAKRAAQAAKVQQFMAAASKNRDERPFAPIPDPRVLRLVEELAMDGVTEPTATERGLYELWIETLGNYYRPFTSQQLGMLQHPAVVDPMWHPNNEHDDLEHAPRKLHDEDASGKSKRARRDDAPTRTDPAASIRVLVQRLSANTALRFDVRVPGTGPPGEDWTRMRLSKGVRVAPVDAEMPLADRGVEVSGVDEAAGAAGGAGGAPSGGGGRGGGAGAGAGAGMGAPSPSRHRGGAGAARRGAVAGAASAAASTVEELEVRLAGFRTLPEVAVKPGLRAADEEGNPVVVDLSGDADELGLELAADQARLWAREADNNRRLARLRGAILASGEAPFLGLLEEEAGGRIDEQLTPETSTTPRDDGFDAVRCGRIEVAFRHAQSWRNVTRCLAKGIRDVDPHGRRSNEPEALPASWTIAAAGRPSAEAAREAEAARNAADMIDDDAVCVVCFDGDSTATNEIVYCDGCNVGAHQSCYGVQTIPDGDWYCDRCRYIKNGGDRRHVTCALCPFADGALKPTNDGRWAHVVCALWTPGVWISNVTRMVGIDLSPDATARALPYAPSTEAKLKRLLRSVKPGELHRNDGSRDAGEDDSADDTDAAGVSRPDAQTNGGYERPPAERLDELVPDDEGVAESVGGDGGGAGAGAGAGNGTAVGVPVTPRIEFEDPDPGHPATLTGPDRVPLIEDGVRSLKQGSSCTICRMRLGRTIMCVHPSCTESFHVTCAWFDGAYMTAKSDGLSGFTYMGGGRGVHYAAYCPAHLPAEAVVSNRSREQQKNMRQRYRGRENLNVESAREKRRQKKANEEKAREAQKLLRKSIAAGAKFFLPEPDKYVDGRCAVCFDPALGDSDGAFDVAVCTSCGITVHKACYGIAEHPTRAFRCDVCASPSDQHPSTTQCELCPRSGGAFVATTVKNKWAHVLCALYTPGVSFDDPDHMRGVNISKVPRQRFNKLRCYVCEGGAGACVQCDAKCYKAMHAMCAAQAEHYFDMQETKSDVIRRVYCKDHHPPRMKFDTKAHRWVAVRVEDSMPLPLQKMRRLRTDFERLRMVLERVVRREKLLQKELRVVEQEFKAERKVIGDTLWDDYATSASGARRGKRRRDEPPAGLPPPPPALAEKWERERRERAWAAAEAAKKEAEELAQRTAETSVPLPDVDVSDMDVPFDVSIERRPLGRLVAQRRHYPSTQPAAISRKRLRLDLQLVEVLHSLLRATATERVPDDEPAAGGAGGGAGGGHMAGWAYVERRVADVFLDPVDADAYPEYYDLIEVPVCLRDVGQRIQWQQYEDMAAMERDLALIVSNARRFNEIGSPVYEEALELEKATARALKHAAAVLDGTLRESGSADGRKRRRDARDGHGAGAGASTAEDGADDGGEELGMYKCASCDSIFPRAISAAETGSQTASGLPLVYAVPPNGGATHDGDFPLFFCDSCLTHVKKGTAILGWRVLVWTSAWGEWRAGTVDAFVSGACRHRVVFDNDTWDFYDLTDVPLAPGDALKTRRMQAKLGR